MNTERKCFTCGKPLKKYQKKYCSLSCKATTENKKSKGYKSRNWKGGKNVSSQGYIRIYKPDHPSACSAGYVYEHRLIMEKYLGRHLTSDEVVHHKNGKKDDNRIENLVLLRSQSDHCALHNEMRETA